MGKDRGDRGNQRKEKALHGAGLERRFGGLGVVGVPDIGDGLGEDRFLSRPSGQGAAAVGIVGKDDIVVAGRLDGEDIDFGEDAPAVGKLAGHDVEVPRIVKARAGEVPVVLGVFPVELAVAGLHVRIDEDPVPVITRLFLL